MKTNRQPPLGRRIDHESKRDNETQRDPKKVTEVAFDAVYKNGNTMIVAPTGTGKTVLMAAQAASLSKRFGVSSERLRGS